MEDETTPNGVFGAKVLVTEGSHAEMMQKLRTLPQFAEKQLSDKDGEIRFPSER